MLVPFNTFTMHSLISFMVTISLAIMFYVVYLKAGRRKLDLLAANFTFLAACVCLKFFVQDNLIPAGMSSYGWEGGPSAEALAWATYRIDGIGWSVVLLALPAQLHFVLHYTQKQNFLRRHIRWAYGLAVLAVPTVWMTPLWITPAKSALAATSSWAVSIPWMPEAGPAVPVLFAFLLALQIYGLILLWKTRKVSVTESESLGARSIVFTAFVVQIVVGLVDVTNASMGLAVPAAAPIGSGIMGVLLAIAMIRSRVEADRVRFQLAGEKVALLECVPQPLLYFGKDSKIQWVNENSASFTDKQPDELIGSQISDIWGAESEEALLVEEAIKTGKPVKREVVRQDESTWIVHASPVVNATGKITGAIELATDITEIRKAQRALRESNTRILMAREEERRRVAQDLHDSIAQGLTALQMQMYATATNVGLDSEEGEKFSAASKRCQQLGTEVRQISHQLYPPALDLLGLSMALDEVFEQYRVSGVVCTLEADDEMRRARFPQGVEVALYRTAQEAISNAVRHGKAKEIRIQFATSGDDILLAVTDNGCGFDVETSHKGLGMTSMTGRIDGIGGVLNVQSQPGKTQITVRVPVELAKADATKDAVSVVN